jgi:glutamate 5-kinase
VGSTVLASERSGIDSRVMAGIARQVAKLKKEGVRVVIVSSGAIAAGRNSIKVGRRPLSLAMKQAAASIGQSRLMWGYERAFARHKIQVSQVLLTPQDVRDRQRFTNLERTIETLLSLDVVPIVNENDSVATEEIRFGDNDRLSAYVAGTVRSDLLLILSDVNGLYTADPSEDPKARRIPHVDELTPEIMKLAGISRSGLGTGGMASKVMTAALANRWGLPVGVILGRKPGSIEGFFNKEEGTLFDSRVTPWPSKKVWIAFFSEPKGRIRADSGAARAMAGRKSSFLAGGVLEIEGSFSEGDVVDLVGPDKIVLGRGRVRLSSLELERWKVFREKGEVPESWPVAIHRNELMLWENGDRP